MNILLYSAPTCTQTLIIIRLFLSLLFYGCRLVISKCDILYLNGHTVIIQYFVLSVTVCAVRVKCVGFCLLFYYFYVQFIMLIDRNYIYFILFLCITRNVDVCLCIVLKCIAIVIIQLDVIIVFRTCLFY